MLLHPRSYFQNELLVNNSINDMIPGYAKIRPKFIGIHVLIPQSELAKRIKEDNIALDTDINPVLLCIAS